MLEHVVPLVAGKCDRCVALVLGRALLWRVFNEEEGRVVPNDIVARVKSACRDLGARSSVPD